MDEIYLGNWSPAKNPGEPATLDEIYSTSRDQQRKVSNAGAMWRQAEDEHDARNAAIKSALGVSLENPFRQRITQDDAPAVMDWTKRNGLGRAEGLLYGGGNNAVQAAFMMERYEQQLRDLREKHPEHADIIGSDRTPWQVVVGRMQEADKAAAEAGERRGFIQSKIPGSSLVTGPLNILRDPAGMAASFAGSVVGMLDSPMDIAANAIGFATGGPAKSLLKNALYNAVSNAAVQAVLEPGVQMQRKAAGLEYGVGQAVESIVGAAGIGAALDVGVRAPVRAIRKAQGATGLGGVLSDAPAEIPDLPKAPPKIDPDVLNRAEAGDIKAQRELATQAGVIDDPGIRTMLDHVEMTGNVDEALRKYRDEMRTLGGVEIDDGDIARKVAGELRAAIDPDALPMRREPAAVKPAAEPLMDVEAAKLLTERPEQVSAIVQALEPRLAAMVSEGLEAGLAPIVRAVNDALDKPETIPAAVQKIAQDMGGMDRLQDHITLHSGRSSVLEVATAMRRSPDLVDSNVSFQTEMMQVARALSTLDDGAWSMVARGEADPRIAGLVADHVETGRQAGVLDQVVRSGVRDLDEARKAIADLEPERMPEAVRNGVDDPNGPETKAATERMEKSMQPETEAARKAVPEPQAGQSVVDAILQSAVVRRSAEAKEAIGDAIRFASRMLPEGVRIEVAPELRDPATGALLDAQTDMRTGDIVIAAKALDMQGKRTLGSLLGHEGVHALVTRGLLAPEEVKLLAEAAKVAELKPEEAPKLKEGEEPPAPEMVFPDALRERYAKAYEGRANLEALLDEEAAAHLIDAVIAKRATLTAEPKTIVERLMESLKAIAERLKNWREGKGWQTADDLINDILAGDVAKREAVKAWMRSEDLTAVAVKPGKAEALDAMYALTDASTGQSMRRDLDALGYYSQALEAARSLKQAKGTPEQMLAQLKSAGVKDAEIEATGLRSLLDGKKSVTRDEIVGHLEGNRVALNEVKYQGQRTTLKARNLTSAADEWWRTWQESGIGETIDDLREFISEQADYYRNNSEPIPRGLKELQQAIRSGNIRDEIDGSPNGAKDIAKYSTYSLDPSNPTYRETVLHLPADVQVLTKEWTDFVKAMKEKYNAGDDWWLHLNEDESRTRLLLGDRLPIPQENFRSGHFPEPNIVGHLMTSMTKHEGKPVYTIDQIQSDWGQKLRDGGVRDEAKIAEIEKSMEAAKQAAMTEAESKISGIARIGWDQSSPEQRWKMISANPNRFPGILRDYNRLIAELATAKQAATGHPLVNTTDQWVNTTLRRALRQAAEADAEYIAIPHGDTVLSYNPGDDDGMRGFYGSRTAEGIVPKNLRKLLERIDKASAKPIRVAKLETTKGLEGYQDEITSGRPNPDSAFDPDQTGFTLFPLSPKVKAEVTQRGQAMFAFAGEKARTADLDALAKAKEMETAGRDRTEIWTETGWFRGTDSKWRFEIDDSAAILSRLKIGDQELVGNVLRHPDLLGSYPQLGDQILYPTEGGGGTNIDGAISVGVRGRPRSVLLHELQHSVQHVEQFARGGSPDSNAAPLNSPEAWAARMPYVIRQMMDERGLTTRRARMDAWPEIKQDLRDRIEADTGKPARAGSVVDGVDAIDRAAEQAMGNDLDTLREIAMNGLRQTGLDTYNRLAGEVEARTVQKRMDLTPEERRVRPPWLDYDVPEDQQVVRFADGTSASDPQSPLVSDLQTADRLRDAAEQVKPREDEGGQKMFALVMSQEARKARAEAMGFDTSFIAYRGLTHPYDEAVAMDRKWQMFTRAPSSASDYAGQFDGANVVPVYLRLGKNLKIDAGGRRWDRIPGSALSYQLKRELGLPMDPVYSVGEIARAIRGKGYDSLSVANVVDNNSPSDATASTVDVIFDPRNIRSVNAAFDPEQSGSANLMYALRDPHEVVNELERKSVFGKKEAAETRQKLDDLRSAGHSDDEALHIVASELEAAGEDKKRIALLGEKSRQRLISDLVSYRNAKGEVDILEAWKRIHERFDTTGTYVQDLETARLAIIERSLQQMSGLLKEAKRGAFTGDLRRRFGSTYASLQNIAREAFGESTGDPKAKALAQAWLTVAEDLRLRFNAAGGHVAKLEKWGLPQGHDPQALRDYGMSKWVDYMMQDGLLDRDRMVSPLTGRKLTDGELRESLAIVWGRITTDGWIDQEITGQPMGRGALYNQHADHRFIHFANADAWMRYAKDFGNPDVYGAMMSHIARMARDIAHMERLGPNPAMMRTYIRNWATQKAKSTATVESLIIEQQAKLARLKREHEKELADLMKGRQELLDELAEAYLDMGRVKLRSGIKRALGMKEEQAKLLAELDAKTRKIDDLLYRGGEMREAMTLQQAEVRQQIIDMMETMQQAVELSSDKDPQAALINTLDRVDAMWEAQRGALVPVSTKAANVMAIGRNLISSSSLGAAVLSSLSDPQFGQGQRMRWGEQFGRSNAARVMKETIARMLKPEAKWEALDAGIAMDAAMSTYHQTAKESKARLARLRDLTGYINDRVLAIGLLTPWTEAGKAAHGTWLQLYLGRHAGMAWGKLPAEIRNGLTAHGFDAASWEQIRYSPLYDPTTHALATVNSKAKQLRPKEIEMRAGRELAERYIAMIVRDTRMAVPESTVESRSMIMGRTRPGTVSGEIVRAFGQFKAFPMAIAILHLGQLAREIGAGNYRSPAVYAGTLLITSAFLGTLSMALKDMKDGRDPRRWLDEDTWLSWDTWAAAMLQSGGLGIYGDFFFSNVNRHGGGLASTIGGPMVDRVDNLRELTIGNLLQMYHGKDTHFGREATRFLKSNTPGLGSWFFTSLAYQRILIDQLQRMVDPKAHEQFRAQVMNRRRDYGGQEYWWRPGESRPERAPDLTRVFATQ